MVDAVHNKIIPRITQQRDRELQIISVDALFYHSILIRLHKKRQMRKQIEHAHMFCVFLINLLVLLHFTKRKKEKELNGMQILARTSKTEALTFGSQTKHQIINSSYFVWNSYRDSVRIFLLKCMQGKEERKQKTTASVTQKGKNDQLSSFWHFVFL